MKKLAWKTMLAISAQSPRLRCAGSIARRQAAGTRMNMLAPIEVYMRTAVMMNGQELKMSKRPSRANQGAVAGCRST